MKALLLFLAVWRVNAQVEFEESTTEKIADVGLRLGLLATNLGVSPVGSVQAGQQQQTQSQSQSSSQSSSPQQSSSFTQQGQVPSGRVPSGGEFGGQQCCCVPSSQQCGNSFGREDDLVGLGLIDQRLNPTSPPSGLGLRIANTPSANSQSNSCPAGQKQCCYDAQIDLSVFGRTCISPQQANNANNGFWRQSCSERGSAGSKQCGTRQFNLVNTQKFGDASPGEFPWTCLILNGDNDFVGTCAIVPNDGSNNNGRGTRKILTAAHKLKNVGQFDRLKVRVGEYDANGANPLEAIPHQEYTVVRILKHPRFDPKRLNDDVAILTVDRNIDLGAPTVNTACFPSCDDQFNFRFNNGTGTRCWVAGWGKESATGSFQVIQRKVDLPIVDRNTCEAKLKVAMNKKRQGLGNSFILSPSEICAGGEVGKDACTGDGGSPLVCQAQSGRWTVVGLVTWGVGCASDVPGVYARISYFMDWINAN